MDGLDAYDPEPRAGRRQGGYGWRRGGTSGRETRTSGGPLPSAARALLAVAVFIFVIDGVNVLSLLDEAARDGRSLPAWIPIGKEGSSGTGALLACGLAYLAMRLATPGRTGWLRVALVHTLGSIAFSGVHQAVMTGLRIVIFAAHGATYHRPPLPADLLYEYRKDLLGYAIIAGLFWLFQAPGLRAPAPGAKPAPEEASLAPAEATFDIVDGAKTLRVPVRRILAVRAVRNYVEFLLEDGRRPMMRVSLAAVETALESRGLMRTHRSWLVNPNRLRSLEATGSGDYRLGLDGDVEVPLSRRFPATLDRLRRGERT
jgi:LytTr DNA-binding domain